jgi:hypothetical protein
MPFLEKMVNILLTLLFRILFSIIFPSPRFDYFDLEKKLIADGNITGVDLDVVSNFDSNRSDLVTRKLKRGPKNLS